MRTIFRYTLSRFRGQILGWGIAILLLGLMLMWFYPSIAEQQENFEQLLEIYPEEMTAFFGDLSTMVTPEGFLSIEYFSYMPLILGIFAVLMGSGLLVSDEENGTLDLVLAHPVSRTALFFGRLLAFVVATLAILAISWLGLVLGAVATSLDLGWSQMGLPFLSLLAMLLLFGALALLLSMLLPSRRLAAMTAGLVLVGSFFITGLARIIENLETVAKFSPHNYYQSGEAMNGLNQEWFWGLVAFAVLFALLAWWRFLRRDVRVGGEGGWRLPSLSLPFRRRTEAGREA